MIRYTVVWETEVEAALANAWILGDSNLRSALTAIADWIDTSLAENAEAKGRPLSDDFERAIDVPLSIPTARVEAIYQVFADDRIVRLTRLVIRSS
jgi:hypothetical protein